MWLDILSDQLPVVALVGRYPTNKLIGREPIPGRKTFHPPRCRSRSCPVLIPVSRSYPRARGRLLTCYSPVRRSSTPKGLSARLACVKHAASVRPEPGSNSPLKVTMTTPAKGPPNLKPRAPTPRRGGIHGKNNPVKATPTKRRRPMTGLCSYALAFSTLLSSQETGAHHPPAFAAHPGQPSHSTLRLPCCQLRFPDCFRPLTNR